jgi:hypothetical protein
MRQVTVGDDVQSVGEALAVAGEVEFHRLVENLSLKREAAALLFYTARARACLISGLLEPPINGFVMTPIVKLI